jgi:hypothetical protein
MYRTAFFCGQRRTHDPVNEIDELITAMLVITFAAVMVVAGELYIKHGPLQIAGPVVRPAVTMASGP